MHVTAAQLDQILAWFDTIAPGMESFLTDDDRAWLVRIVGTYEHPTNTLTVEPSAAFRATCARHRVRTAIDADAMATAYIASRAILLADRILRDVTA